jgi:hypothetical protein
MFKKRFENVTPASRWLSGERLARRRETLTRNAPR